MNQYTNLTQNIKKAIMKCGGDSVKSLCRGVFTPKWWKLVDTPS